MVIEQRALRARRNAPFVEALPFTNPDGSTFDFSGATAAMQVRQYGAQGGAPLINLAQTSEELSEGVLVGNGELTVFIDEATLQLLPLGRPGADVVFVYDLKVTVAGSVPEVWAAGSFTVSPGVTDRLIILTTDAGAVLTTDAGAILTG